jgi:hypothetical protein
MDTNTLLYFLKSYGALRWLLNWPRDPLTLSLSKGRGHVVRQAHHERFRDQCKGR